MKQQLIRKLKAADFLLPGLLTAGIFITVFALKDCFLFGDASLAAGDGELYYVPLLSELRDRLFSGELGLLYSWRHGLGANFYTEMSYYLLSPVNFLAAALKFLTVYEAFDLAVLLKGALAACSMAWFLKKSFGRFDAVTTAFSVIYPFCGFFTAYYINLMWLDALIFLPLIALGIERLVDGKSGVLYCISLALAVITCFYTGYILCIFSVLYLLVRIFGSEGLVREDAETGDAHKKEREDNADGGSNGYMLALLLKFGFYSLTAGALAAFVLYPLYLSLGGNLVGSVGHDTLLFSLKDFIAAHLPGADTLTLSITGALFPNCFSGILTLLLAALFLFTKGVKLGERILYTLLAVFLTASLFIGSLNTLWHGLSFPTMYMHRFVFVYSFLLILIAYKTFVHLRSVRSFLLPLGAVLTGAGIAVLLVTGYAKISVNYMYAGLIGCILYLALLFLYRFWEKRRRIAGLLLLAAVVAEAGFSASAAVCIQKDTKTLIAQQNAVSEAAAQLDNTVSYRAEPLGGGLSLGLTGSFYGLNGIADYHSQNSMILNTAVTGLGVTGNLKNVLMFSEQTPITNTFLALRYLYCFENAPVNAQDYQKTPQTGSVDVYEYKYALPVAFCANASAADWNEGWLSGIQAQNGLFTAATGIKNVMGKLPAVSYRGVAATVTGDRSLLDSAANADELTAQQKDALIEGRYTVMFKDVRKAAAVFTFTADSDAPLTLYYLSGVFTELTIDAGGAAVKTAVGISSLPVPINLPAVKKGAVITVTARLPETVSISDEDLSKIDSASVLISLCSLDKTKFTEGYEYLKKGSLNMTEYSDTYMKGTLTAADGQIIFTSIPYSAGWSAFIDGESAAVKHSEHTEWLYLDVDEGAHTVELRYTVPGLKTGLLVSAAALVLLAGTAAAGVFLKRRSKESVR